MRTKKSPFNALMILALCGLPFGARMDRPDPPAPGEKDPAAGGGGGGGGGNGGLDPAKLQADLTTTAAERDALRKEIDLLKGKIPDPKDLAELTTLREKQKADEIKKKEAEGQYQEIIAAKEKEYTTAVAAKDAEIAKRDNLIQGLRRDHFLAATIPKFATIAPDEAARALKLDLFLAVDNDGKWTIKDETGTHPVSKKTGKPMSPEEFVEDQISKREWMQAFKPKGGSGGAGGNGAGGAGAEDGEWTPEKVQALTPDEYAKNRQAIMAYQARGHKKAS